MLDEMSDEGNPLVPYLRLALVQAARELASDLRRTQKEMDVIEDLQTSLSNTKEAVKSVYEGQARAYIDSIARGLDIVKEVVKRVQSVRISSSCSL